MKHFEYSDGKISEKELFFAIPSMIIGVGILYLPRLIADATLFADGLIVIVVGGFLAAVISFALAKLASFYPGQSFYEYASKLVTQPIAEVITVVIGVHFLLFTAYEVRSLAHITKSYLFDRTPIEVISLSFLLVVIYAVMGERVAILRLNIMFLPLIVFVGMVVALMNIPFVQIEHLTPVFKTDWKGYVIGLKESFFSFAGFSISLFYISLLHQTKNAPKLAASGISIPLVIYLVLYFFCIGVFSYMGTSNIFFPTIELAKEVQVPGGIFERFESIFFTIWIMAIFNTTAMGLDITVFIIQSILPKWKKIHVILTLAPIIYFLNMMPQSFVQLAQVGEWISYLGMVTTIVIPLFLLMIAKVKGVKANG